MARGFESRVPLQNVKIASRTFTDVKTGRAIVANIHAPKREARDWSCLVTIRGLRQPLRHKFPGADSLQALQIAIEGVRWLLEQTGRRISWIAPGDFGIYRPLAGYNTAMTRHLEALVLREITRIVKSTRLRRKFKRMRVR